MQGKHESDRQRLDAARLCRHLLSDGSVEAYLADHRTALFPDELFADLFPSGRGRPSVPPDVVATAMVLQTLAGLSDRDAARAVRDRISWKVACGLALDAEGFDHTVLSHWRLRLRRSAAPDRLTAAVATVRAATGAGPRSARASDARTARDTAQQIIGAIRRLLRVAPVTTGAWLGGHEYDSAAPPVITWEDAPAREAFLDDILLDAQALLAHLEDVALDGPAAEAARLLAELTGESHRAGAGASAEEGSLATSARQR